MRTTRAATAPPGGRVARPAATGERRVTLGGCIIASGRPPCPPALGQPAASEPAGRLAGLGKFRSAAPPAESPGSASRRAARAYAVSNTHSA